MSKGWRIINASDSRLLVRRPLDAATAAAVIDGPVQAAAVEVETGFHQRQDGVDVAVAASLIADRGTEAEERFDFTETYRVELERSLASLRESWEENRGLVTSSTPPLPTQVAAPADEGAQGASPSVQAWQGAVIEAKSAQDPATGVQPEAPVPSATSDRASSNGEGAAPVEDRFAAATAASVPAGTAAPSPEDNMLVLDRTSEPGVWAYYAEHYAKIRGCNLSGRGSVLERKQPDFELHRVHCANGQSLLVKCNAGTCSGAQ